MLNPHPQPENVDGELPDELDPVTSRGPVDDSTVTGAELLSDENEELDEEDADEELDEESEEEGDVSGWFDADTKAFVTSLGVHVLLLVGLAAAPILDAVQKDPPMLLQATPMEAPLEEFRLVDEIAISEEPSEMIGANSQGDSGMAMSLAPIVSDVSEVPVPEVTVPVDYAFLDASTQIQEAVGLVRSDKVSQGLTGVGATGTDGAVDRITYEIMQSIEERPTLVVWLFDQSGSLHKRKQEIRDRFDRIYDELGIVQKARGKANKGTKDDPLLTSVISFGEKVSLLTKEPTSDLNEVRSVIDSIDIDTTGQEKAFSALFLAAERYKNLRSTRGGKDAERNVLMIVVTDERGDDPAGLDATIKVCKQYAMPVYVIGVPAPFGREFAYIKYVDPDPKFDQTPQWAQVDQGPESILPERIQIGFESNYYEEPTIDSGFGPYALSRLCYETGGIFFTVHPNRRFDRRVGGGEVDAYASRLEQFFDPERMVRYQPEYVSMEEYMKRVKGSPLRQALIQASQISRVGELSAPTLRFIKRDEATFVTQLTVSQQVAARLEPKLIQLSEILTAGAEYRDKETSPRWLAGYDLSFGMALGHKVRTEGYNAMLAKAKRGMKFENPKSNTWVLMPDEEVSVGSKAEKEAEQSRQLLKSVVDSHPGTPWAFLAQRELSTPIGWKWVEEFTDLSPPPQAMAGANNNNTPPPPADDQARMLAPMPPRRPIPKL